MSDTQMPSIGRIVHYTSYGTPVHKDGTQVFPQECRAAIVTEVNTKASVALAVVNPTGMYFNPDIMYDDSEDPKGGTWHWPEKAKLAQSLA